MVSPSRPLSRRHFLTALGATAGVVALGACGGDDDPEETTGTGDGGSAEDLVLVSYLGPGTGLFGTGLRNRVPLGLADAEGLVRADRSPDEVEVTILGPDGAELGDPVRVRAHAAGLERAYYPLELAVDEPGIYTARADLGGPAARELTFEVKDGAQIAVLKPGDPMPAVATPTTADARGVDPICTDDPACRYHDVTIAEALAAGQPLAVIVATPAFCKVAACAPAHDVFLDVVAEQSGVRPLHVEVYAHPFVNTDDYAPALGELRLVLEPVAILVGSDGLVAERLDAIYDRDELGAALSRLA